MTKVNSKIERNLIDNYFTRSAISLAIAISVSLEIWKSIYENLNEKKVN